MRTTRSVRPLIISALTLAGFVIVGQLFGVFGSSATDKAEAEQSKALLAEIGKYRKWKLVNPTPVMMNPRAAAACAIAFPVNPHETAWASVYVNPKGASAMMAESHPAFPEGSIIVKEKLYSEDSKDPVVLTVMIKREKGYNPRVVIGSTWCLMARLLRFRSGESCHGATGVTKNMRTPIS